jgi:hypothetical protein
MLNALARSSSDLRSVDAQDTKAALAETNRVAVNNAKRLLARVKNRITRLGTRRSISGSVEWA